ncbi:MAG TPA: pyridoxal phosphate-dependent aminotransferase [Firmicutes bacterium]|nr:pyridoxal phosphate-dependent aminotransferase [Candidatus Fermentithermobacillaceae bacterium]
MRLSRLAKSISPSPTLALDAKTKKLQSEGVDIISFGVGEPDFDTPQHIKDAAISSIQAGFTKYTPSSGIPELRAAICKKLKEDNGLDYKPGDVLVSVGAKHSIYNAVLALCDQGDEVLIPTPYWVSYPEMVKMAGGTPVFVPAGIESDYKVKPEVLESLITPRTSLIILNSPSNPSGTVYTESELRALAEICLKHGVAIISDEIYEKLIYEGEHVSIAALSPEIKAITITVNGVSKSYAMTGWRIGYAAGPSDVIAAMANIQSHSTSNPTSISQKAALAGLTGPQEPLALMRAEFKKRRDFMVKRLNEMPGVKCLTPPGAFYTYPDVSSIIGKKVCGRLVSNDTELAEVLLEEAKIAVVPGGAFGTEGNLRLSYATSMELIAEGLNRMEKALRTVS